MRVPGTRLGARVLVAGGGMPLQETAIGIRDMADVQSVAIPAIPLLAVH